MAASTLRLVDFEAEPASTARAGRAGLTQRAAGEPHVFAVITTRAAFDALEADWTALFERAGRPTQVFQTFAWCWHWCNHFLPRAGTRGGPDLAILTARNDAGRLVLVMPLVKERVGGLSRLVWLGEPVSQYGDAVVDDVADKAALLAAAWSYLVATVRADVVHLRKVRADAEIAPLLETIGAITTERCEAPWLDLTSAPSFAAYEQRYSGKARKNRRRLMRRLEEQGAVALSHMRESEQASATVAAALSLKRAWLKARDIVSPALADPRTGRFFADVASPSRHSAGTSVSALSCNGALAGVQVGFACKGRLALHVIVYDLAYEKSGVGVLHLERAIAQGYEMGLDAIDLLAPNDAYKMDWADGVVGVADRAVPLTLKGRAYAKLYLGHLRRRLKTLARHLPGLARATLAAGHER